jgi:hypothetical protein
MLLGLSATKITGRRRGGGASGPSLAVKATAYEPTGELGANNTMLRNVSGWSLMPGSSASTGSWDTWRVYTGGLIGATGGGWGLEANGPGVTGVGRDTGSTNHTFRMTLNSATNSGVQIIVAGSSMTNCAYVLLNPFEGSGTGTTTLSVYKKDSTGLVSLGGFNYNNGPAAELARSDNDPGGNQRVLRMGDTLEVQVLGQRIHLFLNGKRCGNQDGFDLDTTRAFTKGSWVGFGDWNVSSTLRISNVYVAPLVTTLGLQTESQYDNFPVFWGGIVGSGRSMEIKGTWTGEQPTALRYRVVNETTGVVIQDWRHASGATISSGGSSGTWTVNVQVPMSDIATNPKMRVQVGSYGDADARTMTPRPAAVGYLVLVYGQSNAEGWSGTGATAFTPYEHAYSTGSGGWDGGRTISSTSKARKLGGILAPLLNIPVGVGVFGVAGRHVYELKEGDGYLSASTWPTFVNHADTGDTRFLDNMEAWAQDSHIRGYGYASQFIWVQGEAETSDFSMSEADYRGHFTTLLTNLRSGVGVASAPMNVAVIGGYTGSGSDVGDNGTLVSRVRGWLSRLSTLGLSVSHGINLFDLALSDGIHYTGDSYAEQARRMGYSIANQLGLTTVSGRGPVVTSVTRSGSNLTLNVDLKGSTGLAAQSGLTWYEVNSASDFTGTSYTVSTAAVSGNNIALGLGSTPPGPVYVRSFWRANTLTGAVYAKGNYADGIQIPVEPIYTPLLSD